jgi:signal transduction histidine kinase
LTALQGDVETLRSRGDVEIADDIASIADGMLRHVERELAQARTGARVLVRTAQPIAPVVEQIVRVLHRSPAGRTLDFEIAVPSNLSIDMDAQDLTEILGSLGENAMKWAQARVVFAACDGVGAVRLMVDDDGPGIRESDIETVRSRGGRLPQDYVGSGLGLAIVGDLAAAYGGSVRLGASELGGLRAEVVLPVLECASLT